MLTQIGNAITTFMVGKLGFNLQGAEVLTVRGRKSGQPRTIVVNPIDIDGERYLLSARGESNWVKNVRAVGEISMGRGRRHVAWSAAEITDRDEKIGLMQKYLKRWGWQVQAFMKLGSGSSREEIAARIDEFPMFRLSRR